MEKESRETGKLSKKRKIDLEVKEIKKEKKAQPHQAPQDDEKEKEKELERETLFKKFLYLPDSHLKQFGELTLREIEGNNLKILFDAEKVTERRKEKAQKVFEEFKLRLKEKEERQREWVTKTTLQLSKIGSSPSPDFQLAIKNYKRWEHTGMENRECNLFPLKLRTKPSVYNVLLEIERTKKT